MTVSITFYSVPIRLVGLLLSRGLKGVHLQVNLFPFPGEPNRSGSEGESANLQRAQDQLADNGKEAKRKSHDQAFGKTNRASVLNYVA